MNSSETIDNARLIFNGLEHVEFELTRTSTSYFRIAREAHQILYRSLVEALKGTANFTVTGKPKGRQEHRYQFGSEPIKEIHMESIPGCKHAWRFSSPVEVKRLFENVERTLPPEENYLIPFYDALAKAQAELFMLQFGHSQVVKLTNAELKTLEWLHENIRNNYEHFVPMAFTAPTKKLLVASRLALCTAQACLFESNNVLYFDHSIPKAKMEDMIVHLIDLVDSHLEPAAG